MSACHKDRNEQEPDFPVNASHTLLIYMEGDNSLSRYADGNLRSCMQGLRDAENPLNLVIYKDNNSGSGNGLPELFQLRPSRKVAGKIDTVYIKRWDVELNSADPEVITEVLNLAFGKFDSEVRGVEFWSHGMSWIPSANYRTSDRQTSLTRAQNYIGQDNSDYTEIWQLRDALQKVNYPIDYLMFDACYMATAEVLYELRSTCQYILASCTEIMGDGFPYRDMIMSLSKAQGQDQLLNALRLAFDDYRQLYLDNGTFSLLCTSGAEKLYEACRSLANASDYDMLSADRFWFDASLQHYGRYRANSRYYFYDLADWAGVLGTCLNTTQYDEAIAEALHECVDQSYFSRIFTEGVEPLEIDRSCGLALSVPQLWPLHEMYATVPNMTTAKLDDAYTRLQWQITSK